MQWRIWAAINKPANFPPLSLKPLVMSAKHDTTAESVIIMCTGERLVASVINENKKPIVGVFQCIIHFAAFFSTPRFSETGAPRMEIDST
jgi:hypothetical protein